MNDVTIGYRGRPESGNFLFTGLSASDLRQHKYIIGNSGTGKTTLIRNMIVQDMRAGRGVAVIDPHGDLAEDLIAHIPKHRVNDVVYFNPADIEHPIALNILDASGERTLVASSVVSIFHHQWKESWGPRLEYILYNATRAVLDYPEPTLAGVYKMLVDHSFRNRVSEKIQDPMVRLFWREVFGGWSDRFASEAVSPIQNKLGQLLSSSLMRNILCQKKRSLDPSFLWDKKKIFIANLSKGLLGENRSSLLGSIIITKFYLSALSRASIPERSRNDYYFYIDEFPQFGTDTFGNILSEVRKYKLNLILAHQHLEQMHPNVRAAVFGNVGSFVVFRVGSEDGRYLEKEFEPYFSIEDLRIQQNYEMICKNISGGEQTRPESIKSLPPLRKADGTAKRETIIKVSRSRYATFRKGAEKQL